MDGYLKQSTAGQVRTVGPFVDDGDFKTLENGLTIANTDIVIKKNGAASGTKNSGGATADTAGGFYHLTWDATDSATVGELAYSIKVAGALVVFGKYVVLEEAVYDALFAASAPGYVANAPVNVAQFGGSNGTFSSGLPRVLLADSASHGGTTMVITGERLVFASTTSNEPAWKMTGNGTGGGAHFIGGGTGSGIRATGVYGIVGISTDPDGAGISGIGDSGASGLFLTANSGGGKGLEAEDGATVAGLTTLAALTVSGTVTATDASNDIRGCLLAATGSAALTEGYAADGAAFTLNQGLYMIWSLLAERAISGTTLTAGKLDGTTPAMTFTLDDAGTPNSQTRAT